jgi:hypothetical protein
VTLEGGIDDPDGIDTPRPRHQPEVDEGWDLNAPLVTDEDGEGEGEPGSG